MATLFKSSKETLDSLPLQVLEGHFLLVIIYIQYFLHIQQLTFIAFPTRNPWTWHAPKRVVENMETARDLTRILPCSGKNRNGEKGEKTPVIWCHPNQLCTAQPHPAK